MLDLPGSKRVVLFQLHVQHQAMQALYHNIQWLWTLLGINRIYLLLHPAVPSFQAGVVRVVAFPVDKLAHVVWA